MIGMDGMDGWYGWMYLSIGININHLLVIMYTNHVYTLSDKFYSKNKINVNYKMYFKNDTNQSGSDGYKNAYSALPRREIRVDKNNGMKILGIVGIISLVVGVIMLIYVYLYKNAYKNPSTDEQFGYHLSDANSGDDNTNNDSNNDNTISLPKIMFGMGVLAVIVILAFVIGHCLSKNKK
jgi:hypothetical protein